MVISFIVSPITAQPLKKKDIIKHLIIIINYLITAKTTIICFTKGSS